MVLWLATGLILPKLLVAQPDKDKAEAMAGTEAYNGPQGTSLSGSKKMLHSLGLKPKSVIYYYFENLDLPKLEAELQAALSQSGSYKVLQTLNENQVLIEALPHTTRDTVKELIRYKKQALYLIMVPAGELKNMEDKLEAGPGKLVSKTMSIADDALIQFINEDDADAENKPDDEEVEKTEILKAELLKKGIDVSKDWGVITIRATGNLQEKIVFRPDEYYVNPELRQKGFRQLGQGGAVTLAFLAGIGIGAGVIYAYMKNR